MKKAFAIMLSAIIMLSANTAAFALPFPINSATYVVMEAESGQILASRGADTQKYPASITKILTCAIALQEGDPADRHTMTYKATHSLEPGSTHIALTEEEVVTVEDLLNATMIESANDAANGLAEYISGDIDNFPELMNRKAREIGAEDTQFVNSHGLHDDGHYTTAYDMALITRWALEVEGFRELFGAEDYVVPPTNKQQSQRNLGTHHMMLVESDYYYEGTLGGKLGWTPEARHTMVTLAERNGMELICVVMDSRTQYEKFEDAAKLLDYCYENFTVSEIKVSQFSDDPLPIVNARGEKTGEITIPWQSFFVVHPPGIAKADIGMKLLAPLQYREGEAIEPKVVFSGPDGGELLTVELDWDHRDVKPAAVPAGASGEKTLVFDRGGIGWSWLWLIPAALITAFIVLLIIRHRNLKRREQRRLERRRALEREMELERQLNQALNTTRRQDMPPVMRVHLANSSRNNAVNRELSSRARTNGRYPPVRGREGYRK